MNSLKLLVLPALFVLGILSCGDDDTMLPPEDENPTDTTMADTTTMDTTLVDTSTVCLLLFDENGSPLGTYGNCDSEDLNFQWKNNPNLTLGQKALFDFPDNAEISGAAVPTIERFLIYPSPVPNGRTVSLQLLSDMSTLIKLKIVFTDLEDQPIRELAFAVNSDAALQILLDEDDFPFGEVFRVYYQVLANHDNEVVFEGFGNSVVCDAWPILDIEGSCFQ